MKIRLTYIFILISIFLLLTYGCAKRTTEIETKKEIQETKEQVQLQFCGNGICEANETKCTCPADCGECSGLVENLTCFEYACFDSLCKPKMIKPCCGNNICESGEEFNCSDCPTCNDYNPCTKDYWSIELGTCVHDQIKPCCGNGICEAGEDCSSCFDDCDCGIDLSDFPNLFKGKTVYVVVGEHGSVVDVVAGTDISSILSANVVSRMDSELDSIDGKYAILIGNPCTNRFIEQFLPYERDCLERVPEGKALIKLMPNNDAYVLIVFGHSDADTRRAASKLKGYKTSNLKGTEMLV